MYCKLVCGGNQVSSSLSVECADVDTFKKKILSANPNELRGIDAARLAVYRVNSKEEKDGFCAEDVTKYELVDSESEWPPLVGEDGKLRLGVLGPIGR